MKRKSKSIRERLLVPLLCIMLIQAVFFLVFLLCGGISEKLKSNAIDILSENTENNKLYIERELIHRWMNSLNNSKIVISEIEHILKEEGKTPSDIHTNAELNKKLMEGITPGLIEVLHRGFGNGVFLALDGPVAVNAPQEDKAGVYIRDLDNSSYAVDNSDLLLERGLPSISKKFGIALDSFWGLGFDLSEEALYFHNPVREAKKNGAVHGDEVNYGYLSLPFSLSTMDTEVITYSIPLITSDETVIGVMGVDMTIQTVRSLLNADDIDNSGNGVCFLGIRKKNETTITKIATAGGLYERYFPGQKTLTYYETKDKGIYEIPSEFGQTWYSSIKHIPTYNDNTPFETEELVFVGMVERKDLMYYSDQMQKMLLLVLVVPIAFSFLGVFVTGGIVTEPITRLIKELRSQSMGAYVSLQKVNIEEIDELTDAIETLSSSVEESASKISSILEHANVLVGVYEYKNEVQPVFCSRSFYTMMNWGELTEPYVYFEAQEFDEKMNHMWTSYKEQDEIGNLFLKVPSQTGEQRWLSLMRVEQENGDILGVLSDVTREVLERRTLERERDYDPLTNIYNRRAFKEQVERKFNQKDIEIAAMIMWDLDGLKYINDTYGHNMGDRYISLFADALKTFDTEGGIVSRYAGDEFTVFLYQQVPDENPKDKIKTRIDAFMRQLQTITLSVDENYKIPLRVSAGVSWYPDDANQFNKLIHYADFAMYQVKHSVKGMVLEFDQYDYSDNSYLLSGREELNRLFEAQKVDFAYQPIVTLQGEVYGYEMLMRPKMDTLHGIYEVLNLAKAQSKMLQMEQLTWHAALKAMAEQCASGVIRPQDKVFVNSIPSVSLPERSIGELEKQYAPYLKQLVVELTEGEPMSETSLVHKLDTVNVWGAMIAIDDFGSGYNSEALLLRLNPDIVKIDMSLVRDIEKDNIRQRLLANLISFAKESGILVLAEGVETFAELEVLMQLGVELYQGYYIGRPELEIRPIDSYVIQKIVDFANNFANKLK